MLDGRRSLLDIKHEFQRRFSPQRITERELQFFVADLNKKSLLISLEPDQGRHLLQRAQETIWRKRKNKLFNFLARGKYE